MAENLYGYHDRRHCRHRPHEVLEIAETMESEAKGVVSEDGNGRTTQGNVQIRRGRHKPWDKPHIIGNKYIQRESSDHGEDYQGLALVMGHCARGCLEGTARNPELAGKLTVTMFIGLALIESLTIYALVIALIALYANPLLPQLTKIFGIS